MPPGGMPGVRECSSVHERAPLSEQRTFFHVWLMYIAVHRICSSCAIITQKATSVEAKVNDVSWPPIRDGGGNWDHIENKTAQWPMRCSTLLGGA